MENNTDTYYYILEYGLDRQKLINIIKKYLTPLVIFLKNRTRDNVKILSETSRSIYRKTYVYYSLKANNLKCVLEDLKILVKNRELGFEISSPIEFEIVARYNFRRIMINSITSILNNSNIGGEREKYIKYIIESGDEILITINSLFEAKKLNDILESMNASPINVLLRVNTTMPLEYRNNILVDIDYRNGFIINNGSAKDEVDRIIKEIKDLKKIKIKGLTIHKLVNTMTPEPYHYLLKKMANKSNYLREKFNLDIEYIDLGGGLHARYKVEKKCSKYKARECLKEFFKKFMRVSI